MDFDALVARLEASLLPVVRREEERLRASGKYTNVEIVSLRHAPVFHVLGIACRPTWATMDLERLTFCAQLNAFRGPYGGRIDIGWNQIFIPRIGSGYLKKETRGFYGNLTTESDIKRFERKWVRMNSLFLRVADKGHPSARWLRWLRGAPRDWRGFKERH